MGDGSQLTPLSTLRKQPGPINWIPDIIINIFIKDSYCFLSKSNSYVVI